MAADAQQLTKPELLSESVLINILKSRCIVLPNVKRLRKSDLIEMYKRIVLPLPQRQYNNCKPLGKKLSDLRLHRKIAVGDQEHALHNNQNKVSSNSSEERLKWYDPNEESPTKKPYLSKSSTPTNNSGENGYKRKYYDDREVHQQNEVKKHKKITWP